MSNMSEHPCHNLSNTDKQIFTCRHCMAKFYDPIQRWRHSKSCKKDAPTKGREGIPLSNVKRDLPVETAERGGLSKKRQKKENPLNCVICKSVFTSLEEMKEHVRNPCSKPPPEPKAQALAPPNSELENFEQQLQQLQDAKGEDIATNQIESLLRAAQALHQQQQEQQRQQAEQLQNVETEVIPDGGNPDWLYNQGEPVLCSVEEYGEPGFPNYSSIQGSDSIPVVQVEQVSSTPAVEEERSLHTPPIKLNAEEYDPVTPQEITVTSGHDAHAKSTQSTYSEQQILDMKRANGNQEVLLKEGSSDKQGALSDEKFIFSSVGFVESIQSQPSTTGTQDLYGISAHPSVLPSEVKLVGSDGVTFTLVLSPNTSTDTLPKSGNPGDEFDFISQVIGEDLTQQDSIEKQDSQDSKIICKIDTNEKCGFDVEIPELNSSSVSGLSQNEQSGKAIACEHDNLNTAVDECVKDKQFNRSEKTKGSDTEQSPFKGKNSFQSTTIEPLVNTNSESDNLTSDDKKVPCNQQTNDDTSTQGSENNKKNSHIIELGDKAQGGIHKEKLDSADQIKVVKKKHKNVKIPKCRVCDKEFKTKEQLRKHNKVPCKVRLTRNLTQKVLRPKRLEKSVPLPIVKKKKKQKPVPAKPKMITLINRRFADTSLDLNKDKKGKFKTRRKSLYDYNFCITRSTDYRNANLDVLVQYDSLNEQEQHFFHLGLVGTNHLPSHYRTPKSLIKRVLKQNGSHSMEKVLEIEEPVEDGPPVLEKVVDASGRIQEDIYILRDEIHHDIEPPVLMTVEKLDAGCSVDERLETSRDMMCPTLVDELTENFKLPNSESCNKEKLENNEPNKENSFHDENLSGNKTSEQNSKEEQKLSSELLTGADKVSPLKSPNKTLGERHFMDAIDVSSDTFSDESEFTKTKLKEEDGTKPSYSVTLGLQTDIPSVTDKIMYPRSSFILKCLKRLENKHKNIPDSKPCGRKNLFESLENVSEDSKSCNISQCKDEKYTKNVNQTQSEKNVLTKPIEEVMVYPKPVDPKNLEYRKPTFIIPSDEEILNYSDDTVVRKQPELDSVSPENGRDLLQILAKTLGIFPSTKTKPLETSLIETPKHYKETSKKDAVDDENGMQIIVMNNTSESNEYTMGIDVINVPKSINEDLKKAASELESNCVFEDDNPQGLAYPVEDASSEKKAQSSYSGANSDPGDISIPKEVYEFLEDYNTISPKAPEPNIASRHDAQILQPTRDIHMVPGPKLNTSEVVDIHFNLCSKKAPPCEQPKSHPLTSSNAHNVNPVADLKPLQNNEQGTPFGSSVNTKDEVLQTEHLHSNEDLPLYAIPVGYVSENCQTSSGTTCCPENQPTLSTSQPLNQDNNTACNQPPSRISRPLKELSISIPSQMSSEKSDADPVFSHSIVFKSENAQEPSVRQSIPNVSESIPESDQVWSRILEEYKAERMQNHNHPEESSLSRTAKQQKPRTLSYKEEHADSFISKPVFTRSYSTSATSTLSNASNQTVQHHDDSEKVFMSCSFSPTNSSNSLKMIFRKERSPKEENQSVNASSEERICSSETVNERDQLRETNLSTADSDPSPSDVGATDDDEEESLPYMIVDTGVEICRKALGTHEDEVEDLSEDEDWISGQDVESQDAVT